MWGRKRQKETAKRKEEEKEDSERQAKQEDITTHAFGPLYPGFLSREGPKVIQNLSLFMHLYSHSSISLLLSPWVMVLPGGPSQNWFSALRWLFLWILCSDELFSPSLAYLSLGLTYLDNRATFFISQVPIRWLNLQSKFQEYTGAYSGTWAVFSLHSLLQWAKSFRGS